MRAERLRQHSCDENSFYVVSIMVTVHQSQLVSPHRGHPHSPHATTILPPTPSKMLYSLNAVNSCGCHHVLCLQFTSSFYYHRESVFQWLGAWWSKNSSLALSSAPHSKALIPSLMSLSFIAVKNL